jgi:Bifunctional DNA primase/polymerase, N-terminal
MATVNGGLDSAHPYRSGAGRHRQAGWFPVALPYRMKHPPERDRTGWSGIDADDAEIDVMVGKGARNLAIRMPGDVVGIDVDNYNGKHGLDTITRLALELGPLPETWRLTSRSDGSGIRFYRVPTDLVLKGIVGPGVEIVQRRHRYAVTAPSIHPEGRVYRWLDVAGNEADEVPDVEWLPALPEAWRAELERTDPRPGGSTMAGAEAVDVWLADHDGWAPCAKLEAFLEEFRSGRGARHDGMLDVQIKIVNSAQAGHRGGTAALRQLSTAFTNALGGDRNGEYEFLAGLAGAVGRVLASPPRKGGCCNPVGIDESRPELLVTSAAEFGHSLREAVAERRLVGLFRRGDEVVRVHPIGSAGYQQPRRLEDDNGPTQVRSIGNRELVSYLHESAFVYKVVDTPFGRAVVETYAPITSTDTTLQQLAHDERVPVLRAVTHVPVLRPDGTVVDRPGYDATSETLYMPPAELAVPAVPARPSLDELAAATGMVLDLLADFPWVSREDRSNYLGLLLTPLLRPVLDYPGPFGLVTARDPGTGKTLLSTVLGTLYGLVRRAELPPDDEEVRKQVTSILVNTTAPVVCWDNVSRRIDSAQLAKLLTDKSWSDRVLGSTAEVGGATNRVWLATGNNLTLGGDMARRGLWVRLDARQPHPELRTAFAIPHLEEHVKAHRGELLAALLTIVRAWFAAGSPRPAGSERYDSFGPWFGTLGGILTHAGLPNVGRTEPDLETFAQDDEEAGEFHALAHDEFGDREVTAREVAAACTQAINATGAGSGRLSPLGHALPDDLRDKLIGSGYAPAAIVKTLTRWLGRIEGRWAGDWTVHKIRTSRREPDRFRFAEFKLGGAT